LSQIRLLVDEDAQHRGLAPALRARGVEVITAREAGLVGADDAAVLAHAASGGRAVYTSMRATFADCTASICGKGSIMRG
jgi:predicted nuclease of predicted toxin-antitoxin system